MNRLAIQGRAQAFGGREQFIAHGLINHAYRGHAINHQRDRDAEMRNAPREIRCSVNRIDDPGPCAYLSAVLLAEKSVSRESRKEPAAHQFLDLAVGGCQVILRTFEFENHRISIQKAPLLQRAGFTRYCACDLEPVSQGGFQRINFHGIFPAVP
jgi:hypothetical protein